MVVRERRGWRWLIVGRSPLLRQFHVISQGFLSFLSLGLAEHCWRHNLGSFTKNLSRETCFCLCFKNVSKSVVPNPGHGSLFVRGLLWTGLHRRRWTWMYCLDHPETIPPPTPSVEKVSSRNWSLVPKELGTTVLKCDIICSLNRSTSQLATDLSGRYFSTTFWTLTHLPCISFISAVDTSSLPSSSPKEICSASICQCSFWSSCSSSVLSSALCSFTNSSTPSPLISRPMDLLHYWATRIILKAFKFPWNYSSGHNFFQAKFMVF